MRSDNILAHAHLLREGEYVLIEEVPSTKIARYTFESGVLCCWSRASYQPLNKKNDWSWIAQRYRLEDALARVPNLTLHGVIGSDAAGPCFWVRDIQVRAYWQDWVNRNITLRALSPTSSGHRVLTPPGVLYMGSWLGLAQHAELDPKRGWIVRRDNDKLLRDGRRVLWRLYPQDVQAARGYGAASAAREQA